MAEHFQQKKKKEIELFAMELTHNKILKRKNT